MPTDDSIQEAVAPEAAPVIDLRKLRDRLGWSQGELGEFLGCSQSAVSRMENGGPIGLPFQKLLQQPRTPTVEITATVRVPDTLAVEDALGEAECRLHAAASAAFDACTDKRAGDGLAYIIHDVCDIIRDAADTLRAMRQEGGAA